jgi:hypothetical protein
MYAKDGEVLGCAVRSLAAFYIRPDFQPTSSTEKLRKLRRERYHVLYQRKVKQTPANRKGRCTNEARTPSVKAKQRHLAAVLREAKNRWSEDEVQEQARLLAAYHNIWSMKVPHCVKGVYAHMERCVFAIERANNYVDKVTGQYVSTIGRLGSRTGHFLEM